MSTQGITQAGEQIRTSTKKTARGLGRETLALRESILDMVATGYIEPPFTVRQAFYRLTTIDASVEKTEAGYRRVQRQILHLRREGLLPYRYVADNSRVRRKPATHDSLADALETTAHFYRAAVWRDIDAYVEIWCEKTALAGVMYPVTKRYDVPLLCASGYSSETFAYEAAQEMRESGKPGFIYYFGDFDPSGWQMAESLQKKLSKFNPRATFKRVAVNPEQIDIMRLPSRPTKKTDTRYRKFVEMFGDVGSVELDAINPATLRHLVQDCIEQHIPAGHLAAMADEEEAARYALSQMARGTTL